LRKIGAEVVGADMLDIIAVRAAMQCCAGGISRVSISSTTWKRPAQSRAPANYWA